MIIRKSFILTIKKTAFYSSGHLILGYRYRTKTIREMQAKLNAKIDSFLVNCIRPSMSEYEKIKAIHDFLVTNTVYDYENYKKEHYSVDFLHGLWGSCSGERGM